VFVLYEGAVLWLIHKVPQVQNAHDYAVFVTMKGWPHGCKRVGLLRACIENLACRTEWTLVLMTLVLHLVRMEIVR